MESTSISDVRRMCQRGAFRAYVQGGKVFLEDTATGQVVPLNGESGHAKAEREPAAHRQEQRGSRVERMFGKRDTWQAPTNPDADQGPYKGFLMVQCEECGAIKAFCAKHETYGYKCGECGHETPLEKLRPLFIHPVRMGIFDFADAVTLQQYIGALNTIRENILNLYTKKTGREKDEVAAWMDATSWWTGEEAKTNGFVDELVDDGEKTVVENRGGLLFVNSVNMNLPFDKAPKFVQNSVAAAPAASGFVNTQTPAEQPGNKSHKEDTNMANEIKTVDELRGAYPALVDQIEQAAALRATNEERQRIRDIEEMALPGSEQITNEAKYDKPMSASDYAKAAMKNAKEQGAAWLNTMQQGANASGVNSVGSAPAPTGGEKPDEFMDAIKGLGKKQ